MLIRFGVLFALAAAAPQSSEAAEKTIRMASSNSAYSNLFKQIAPEFEKKTGIKIQYLKNPEDGLSGKVNMKAVLDGAVDAGAAGNPFSEWVKLLAEEIPQKKLAELTHRVIGKDLLFVVSHPKVGVESLSLAQLEALFSGKLKNWKEVGGGDLPVTLVFQEDSISRFEVFKAVVLNGKEYGANQKWIKSASKYNEFVSKTPGTLGFLPLKLIHADQVRILKTKEEIGRPITLITKGRPTDEVMSLIQFIATEGPKILKQVPKGS